MIVIKLIFIIAVVAGIVYSLLKKYNPQSVLLFGGIAMVLGAMLFNWESSLVALDFMRKGKTTGSSFFDLFFHLQQLFSYRLGGLGLTIMAIGGFAHILSESGASNELVYYTIKPVAKIKNPYLLIGLFYIVGAFLSLFITSAVGLGLLCMVTIYPILTGLGVSPLSAVGMIITTECMDMGVLSTNTLRASEVAGIDISTYFTDHQLIVFIPTVLVIAITHIFWQKYQDKKSNYVIAEHKVSEGSLERKAPGIYALLPLLPFVLILIFGRKDSALRIGVPTAMFVSTFAVIFFELVVKRKFQAIVKVMEDYFAGMVKVFPAVSLIVCAGFFADGLIAIGAVDILVNASVALGFGGTAITILMAFVIAFLSVLLGSGNAAFLSIIKLVPGIATKFGITSLTKMIVPLNLVAGIGRSMSPIAAVVIACCDIAQVSPFDAIKRSVVPMVAGFITILITSFLFL